MLCNDSLVLQWSHNERDGVSHHRRLDCLLNSLFRRQSKKTSKLRDTGLCEGIYRWPVDSPHKRPVTREIFPFDDIVMSCLMCHFSHSQTNTVVTDGLVSSWYQDIGNDHDDIYRSALVRSIQHKGVVASHVRHKHRLMMTSPNGIFSALLALCAGNSPVTGEFPSQRPVTRSIGVFSDLRLNKRLSKQSGHRWSETPSCSLKHYSNIILRVGWNSFFIVWPEMGNIPLP